MSKQTVAKLEAELLTLVNKHSKDSQMSLAEVVGTLDVVRYMTLRESLKTFDSKFAQDEPEVGHSPIT